MQHALPIETAASLKGFIAGLPKAELHVHIEGTLAPAMMIAFAERNGRRLRYRSVEDLSAAYRFGCLQNFLDVYYEGAGVLITEADFYDLTRAYLDTAALQNIRHCEIFFDPQTHTHRGVAFDTVIHGIHRAITDARCAGPSARLIMCFLRDLDEDAALKTLTEALPHRDKIIGVGLDSAEVGHPPWKFKRVFARARDLGLFTVAHAGEEGPADYIWGAIEHLKVSRIDHGNHAIDDPKLMAALAARQIPLTLCPLSNLKLKVVTDLTQHPLGRMLAHNLLVTVNSDDPAYFGGDLCDNYLAIAHAQHLSKRQLGRLAKNSFTASFLSEPEKKRWIGQVDAYLHARLLNTK